MTGNAFHGQQAVEEATRDKSTDTMFTTRSVPWMKLGEVIDAPLPAAEAMTKAGLDFDVKLQPVQYRYGKNMVKFEGRCVAMREDTGDPLGVVSDDYEVVQYREAFDFIDGVNPVVVAAGALKNYRHGFLVVKTDNAHLDVLDGDTHDIYTILRTSHDGSKAIEVFLMSLRGKCMNQLALSSMSSNAVQRWSFRHVEGVREKMLQAQKVIGGVDLYAKEFNRIAEQLAAVDVELEQAEALLKHVLPDRPKRDDVITSITGLFQSSPTIEGFHGTGWGLVNAVGEYYDHIRPGGTPESHFINALSGSTNKYVNRTAQLLVRR